MEKTNPGIASFLAEITDNLRIKNKKSKINKVTTIVYIGTSLDGFIARKNGEIDWLEAFANEEAFSSYDELLKRIDAIVIGRGTFEKVLSFPSWPYTKPVFVLSNSIKVVPEELKEKITIQAVSPREMLNHLSKLGYSGIYVDGGRVIQEFLREDLIDEMIISKVPVLIGSGIPLFDYLDKDLVFSHIKTDVTSNGLVRSYYKRIRK